MDGKAARVAETEAAAEGIKIASRTHVGCILADSLRHDKQALMPIYSRKLDVFRILFRNPLIKKR